MRVPAAAPESRERPGVLGRSSFWLQELLRSCVEMRGGTEVLCTPKAFDPIAQRRERSERTLGMAGKFQVPQRGSIRKGQRLVMEPRWDT